MKIGLISLGCPKNLVDSEVMLGLAAREGHQLTRDAAEADVLVVNTCAFIDGAKRESIDTILEMAEHKKTGRCVKLVVTGCMAERYRDELLAQIPEIDVVLGTGEVPAIVGALAGVQPGGIGAPAAARPRGSAESGSAPIALLRADGSAVRGSASQATDTSADANTDTLPSYLYDADTPRLLATPRHYAYLKIAEGCDYACAFCIIPTLRGHYRSRPVDSIVREAARLAAGGVKELLLISQDTTFYGIDRGERGALATLLDQLDQVEGLEWIRLLYLYPTTITDEVIAAIGRSRKVCRYIDLPLQHAADAVLKRMGRPGTRASYTRLLAKIRTALPNVTLRTTFIVGFPGETDADFEALEAFVRETAFDHVGVFTYSHEEGTPAFALDDDVPAAVKRDRQRRLMGLQKRMVARAQRRRVGEHVRVVVDGPAAEHELVLRARTAGQAPDIDPQVYLTECDPSGLATGQFIDVEITGSRGYDLVARPLSVPVPV